VTIDREPVGAPVTAVKRTSRGPSSGLVLVLVAATVAAAVSVALVPGPQPGPTQSRLAETPSASVARGQIAASPAPGPSLETGSTVVVLRDTADPGGTLGAMTGCPGLVRSARLPAPVIEGAEVDATAEAAGRGAGWLFVPPGVQAATRVWLGDDVVALAEAAGRPVVAVGTNGEVWLGGPAGATRWSPIATPGGRTAWVMDAADVAGRGHCEPWTVPASIARLRSLTCAGVGMPACLDLLPLIGSDAVGVLQPGGDLVVAVPPCMDSHRCYATPYAIIGVPAGWSGSFADIHAVGADPGSLPDYALDALGRPALPLPTGGEQAASSHCSESLTGELHASPWDPRVAWVGGTAVVWPTGTTIRFLPVAELTAGGGQRGSSAAQDAPVTVSGSFSSGGLAFDACAVAETPSAAPERRP
jgi:hypothetical protein